MIAVSNKCCWCCDWLGKNLETEKFTFPGTAGAGAVVGVVWLHRASCREICRSILDSRRQMPHAYDPPGLQLADAPAVPRSTASPFASEVPVSLLLPHPSDSAMVITQHCKFCKRPILPSHTGQQARSTSIRSECEHRDNSNPHQLAPSASPLAHVIPLSHRPAVIFGYAHLTHPRRRQSSQPSFPWVLFSLHRPPLAVSYFRITSQSNTSHRISVLSTVVPYLDAHFQQLGTLFDLVELKRMHWSFACGGILTKPLHSAT